MRKLLTILFLFIAAKLYAQDEPNFRLFTNVFQNVDISHPRLNLGLEKNFDAKQSIAVSFGVYYYNPVYNEQTSGFNYGAEYKHFLKKRFYIAVGANYGNLNYDASSQFTNQSTGNLYSESFRINKSVSDLYSKFGIRLNFKGSVYFDCFAGLGARYKETVHSGRSRPNDPYYTVDLLLVNVRDDNGYFFTPIAKLGIVVGLKLK